MGGALLLFLICSWAVSRISVCVLLTDTEITAISVCSVASKGNICPWFRTKTTHQPVLNPFQTRDAKHYWLHQPLGWLHCGILAWVNFKLMSLTIEFRHTRDCDRHSYATNTIFVGLVRRLHAAPLRHERDLSSGIAKMHRAGMF